MRIGRSIKRGADVHPPHHVSCLLDARADGLSGDLAVDTLWTCGAGPTVGYRTSTVRKLVDAGYLMRPAATSAPNAQRDRPDRFRVVITEAGLDYLKRHHGDHPLLNDATVNRGKWRVVEGSDTAMPTGPASGR